MALVSRIGNMLKHTRSKHANIEYSLSNLSVYQAVRCMSSSQLFIGGLSYATDEPSLREAFAQHGEVTEVKLIIDRVTGKSRGFGFVSFASSEEASGAKQAMDGKDLHSRRVRVDYATDRPRAGGFGGGGYGGGNYGDGGYGGGNYGDGGGYRGGGNNYGGGYGSYSGGGNGVGSYAGGNSGGYGRGSNSEKYGVAGNSDISSAVGGSGGEFGDSGFSGTEYGSTTGTGGGNESFSMDRDDEGEPDAVENTRS